MKKQIRNQKSITFSGETINDLEKIHAYCKKNMISMPKLLVRLGVQFIEKKGDVFDEDDKEK